MQYLGNILSDCDFDSHSLFNITNDESKLKQGIPTLMTGWMKVKKIYPQQSILDWRIADDLYWTFSDTEKRDKMESDYVKFKELCFNRIKERIHYEFYNVLKNEGKYPEWRNMITSIYINNDMAYCYVKDDNIVYGISLRDVQYFGINPKAMLRTLYDDSKPAIVKKENGITYEILTELKNEIYLIPFIFGS